MSVYKSTTLGPIPLSFTGRHLMQNLREAMTEYASQLANSLTKTASGNVVVQPSWEPVSRARGKLAQHMSRLEAKTGFSDEHGYQAQRDMAPQCGPAPWDKDFEFYRKSVAYDLTQCSSDLLNKELDRRGASRVEIKLDVASVSTDELLKELKRRLNDAIPPFHMNCRSVLVDPSEYKAPKKRAKKRKASRKHK